MFINFRLQQQIGDCFSTRGEAKVTPDIMPQDSPL